MPKTLLLADDSVVIQKLVGLSFANEDVELITTDNGDDALTRARTARPDLVLADVVMPGKNGYEVCQSIKSDPDLRHIPVLLLTGTFEAFDENRAREVGSDGHITKPFEAQGLVDRVTDLLSRTPAAPPAAAPAPPQQQAPPQQAPPQQAPPQQAPPQRAPQTPPPAHSETYDFFDDEVQELAAPEEPAATSSGDLDDAFEFGSDLDAFAGQEPGEPATLDTNFELDEGDGAEDMTVAVLEEESRPAPTPQAPPAPGATQVHLGETVVEHEFASAPPRVESLDARLAEPGVAPAPPRPPPSEERAETMLADDLFDEPARMTPSPAPTPRPTSAPPPAPSVAAGPTPPPIPTAPAPPVASAPVPPAVSAPVPPPVSAPVPPAVSAPVPPAVSAPVPPAVSAPVPPAVSAPVPPAVSAPVPPAVSASIPPAVVNSDSGFEFEDSMPAAPPEAPRADLGADDSTDPLAGMGPEPDAFEVSDPTLDTELDAPAIADAAESTHSGDYDVSISDLGDPLASGGPGSATTPPAPARAPVPAPIEPEVMATDYGMAAGGGPDVSPVLRQQIHETLEKVAWEAFADLSDSIVRQVLQRVESVVWEIVPQMAETLIQEEIRRMKGEG